MKVLCATGLLQGFSEGDYNYCDEGELVHLNIGCDTACVRRGELCGTCRAFCGFDSQKGTTTAIVRETEMTFEELLALLRDSFAEAGFDSDAVVYLNTRPR